MDGSTMKMLNVDHVSVTYPNGHVAITDISVQMDSGNICGLIGMNGSGKSTLFKCMMGVVTPTSGRVLIDGEPVRCALAANKVAYVPQSEDVDWNFPVLVEDVVMMGRFGRMGFLRIPSQKDKDIVTASLERVKMEAFRHRQIGELSGGQKKRVFVARALAQESKIILLDEPFTGVDTTTEDALIQIFRSLSKEGHLIVVSTHNLGSVPDFCDNVLLINQQLLAFGPIQSTFTQKNLLKTFGGMLRHQQILSDKLHQDNDHRSVAVLTDDERPVVFYGEQSKWDIIKPKKNQKKRKTK